MTVHACLAAALLSLHLPWALADANITLFTLPINLTSWRLSLHDALNQPLSRPLEGLMQKLGGHLQFARNGSIGCAEEGEECIPGIPTCCPAVKEADDDLQCLPQGESYFCGALNSSEDLAQERLDALQYGDSMAMFGSHPWVDSWEFQSRSAMEREEELAAEEAAWKKKWKPSTKENFWMNAYRRMKNTGKDVWHDVRKMKKLKEIKESLIDKYKKRVGKAEPAGKGEERKPPESPVMYPEETSEKVETAEEQDGKKSEESFIKFSDEIPKREKKIKFRIDDIIKDAARLVGDKLKKKAKATKKHERKGKPPLISTSVSVEQPFHADEIKETEYKLKKEISELNKLKQQQQEQNKHEHKANEPDIDELIRRQVSIILEEERKLRKIEELRRLEREMKH